MESNLILRHLVERTTDFFKNIDEGGSDMEIIGSIFDAQTITGDYLSIETPKWSTASSIFSDDSLKMEDFDMGKSEFDEEMDILKTPDSNDGEIMEEWTKEVNFLDQEIIIRMGINFLENHKQDSSPPPSPSPVEQIDNTECGSKFKLIHITESDIINGQQEKFAKPMRNSKEKLRNSRKKEMANGDNEYVPILEQFLSDFRLLEKITSTLKKGRYKCTHCKQDFKHLLEYVAHMDEFKVHRRFKCSNEECPYKIIGFARSAEYKRHFKSQHLKRDNNDAIVCEYDNCHKAFPRKDSLKRHEKLCHLNQQSRFNIRRSLEFNETKKTRNRNATSANLRLAFESSRL